VNATVVFPKENQEKMKGNATATVVILSVFLCSCATLLPDSAPEHQTISSVVHASVQNAETKINSPIRVEIRGNRATAFYTVEYRTGQQPWNPMKSILVKQTSGWVVKESKSTKPWYYRYK
jgi:hypothetical protein